MTGRFSLRQKLYLVLLVNILLLAGLGYAAAVSSHTINQELQSAFNRDLKGLVFLLEADRDLHQSFIAELSMLLAQPDTPGFRSRMKDYLENKGQADTRIAEFAKLTTDQEQLSLVAEYTADRKKWDEFAQKILMDKEEGASEAYLAALTLGEENKRFTGMRSHIDVLTDALLRQAKRAEMSAGTLYRNMLAVIIALTIGSAVIGAAATFLMSRGQGAERPGRQFRQDGTG